MRQAQDFIRREQPALTKPLGIAVLRYDLRHGEGLPGGHGGVHVDGHVPAAGGNIGCRHIVRAAEHELGITAAEYFGPKVVAVSVLQLRQALQCQYQRDRARPKRGDRACEIPAVVSADGADVRKFVEYEVDRYGAATARRCVCEACQPDKQEREEQRGKEVHGAVLIVEYHEVSAFALCRGSQVDVTAA